MIRTGKIRSGLVGGRRGGGALPSGHVNGLKVLCHLGHLDWVQTSNVEHRGELQLLQKWEVGKTVTYAP